MEKRFGRVEKEKVDEMEDHDVLRVMEAQPLNIRRKEQTADALDAVRMRSAIRGAWADWGPKPKARPVVECGMLLMER